MNWCTIESHTHAHGWVVWIKVENETIEEKATTKEPTNWFSIAVDFIVKWLKKKNQFNNKMTIAIIYQFKSIWANLPFYIIFVLFFSIYLFFYSILFFISLQRWWSTISFSAIKMSLSHMYVEPHSYSKSKNNNKYKCSTL